MARKKHTEFFNKGLKQQIRALIAERFQSLDEFERETGVPKSTVSRILREERRDCTVSTLGGIAKALKKKLVIRFE